MEQKKRISFILILFTFNIFYGQDETSKEERPNIILINIDDMGWKDVGFMGSKYYETPTIDALAAEGMIFNQAYAAAANCAPSRACLMSGENTPRHGVYTVNNSDRGKSKDRKLIPVKNNFTIDENFLLLPEILKENGYTTCHAGKWHITKDPKNQGFDVNIGGSHAGNPGSYYPPYKNVPSIQASNNEYLTDIVMNMTLDFVNKNHSDPFFLYYSPYAVHTPIHPVMSLLDKYKSKQPSNGQNNPEYATMVENLDRNIGRLIRLLKEKKVYNNTFIFFISDNGGVYKVTKQKPLRAGKGSYYEGGIREPAFAVWQGKINKGSITEKPITNLDIFPTLLEVANIEKPEGKILDGMSLLPFLTKKEDLKLRPLFWHFPIYLEGGNIESQDPIFRTRPGSAIRLGDWKLIQYFENNELELYNLKEDISENNNLFEDHPKKGKELLSVLENWRRETNAPIPQNVNPDYKKSDTN
jgi:arylsulfatase A-like enzyme